MKIFNNSIIKMDDKEYVINQIKTSNDRTSVYRLDCVVFSRTTVKEGKRPVQDRVPSRGGEV